MYVHMYVSTYRYINTAHHSTVHLQQICENIAVGVVIRIVWLTES
jgi:hypothetical protein